MLVTILFLSTLWIIQQLFHTNQYWVQNIVNWTVEGWWWLQAGNTIRSVFGELTWWLDQRLCLRDILHNTQLSIRQVNRDWTPFYRESLMANWLPLPPWVHRITDYHNLSGDSFLTQTKGTARSPLPDCRARSCSRSFAASPRPPRTPAPRQASGGQNSETQTNHFLANLRLKLLLAFKKIVTFVSSQSVVKVA